METFVDSIGLRVGNGRGNIMNTIDSKDMLERVSREFVTLIVDATEWTRMTGKPFVLEFRSYVGRGLVVDADDFG